MTVTIRFISKEESEFWQKALKNTPYKEGKDYRFTPKKMRITFPNRESYNVIDGFIKDYEEAIK